MAYVYRHIRLDKNQPFYIGIGTSEYYNRAYRHKNRSDLWKRIAQKGGYEVEILMDNLTWEQACEKEKEFIKLYGRIDLNTGCLANMTDGGDGAINAIITEEHRRAVAEANKRRVYTEEDRKKISLRHTGRKHSEESKKNISYALKNSEKHKQSILINSQKHKGFKHSDSTKKRLSQIKSTKPIVQFDMDGNYIRDWSSAKEVQRCTGMSQGNVSRCCNGEYKQAYGYIWKYKN